MSLLDGPVFRENKNVDKIFYGCDDKNIYFRLHVNKGNNETSFVDRINQFYLYIRNATNIGNRNIRIKNIGILMGEMVYVNKNTIFDSRVTLSQGEETSQYYDIKDLRVAVQSYELMD